MPKEKSTFNRAKEVLFKLPLAVLAENEHREISFANQHFCDLFDIPLSPQALSGMDCSNLAEQSKAYFKNPDIFLAYINQAIEFQQPLYDVELQLTNGVYLAATYVPYFKEDVFAGHIWTYKDISLRKAAQMEVERQKAFSAEILDSLPADIAIFDQDHKYIYTNYTAIKNPEMREWIKGKDDFDYCKFRNLDTKLAEARRLKFIEALSSNQQIEWEDKIVNPDGEINYVLRRLNPSFDENDQLKFMVGYGININEIKRKTEELQLSEYKYKTVVNQLQEIIFRLNTEGIIEFLNPAWEKITGFSVEFALGKNIADFGDPGYTYEVEKKLHNLTNGKEKEIFSLFKIIAKSKEPIYLETYASLLNLGDGQTGVWGTFTNITEKRKAENGLLKTIQKERELNSLKSGFVNMVSHEIRTPMAGILSSLELLELIQQGDPAQIITKSEKHFKRIKSQIKRVNDLMNDVLLLGKIEAGKVEYHPDNVDVLSLVKEIIDHDFNKHDTACEIKIEVSGENRLSRLDSSLFRHIVINLLSNAIKYSKDKPSPIVKLGFNMQNIEIEVTDFGIGIPAQEQKNLFSAFSRASNSRNIEGTGLGLVVVKHFVDMHKGKISFKSKENEGSSFKITLPG